MYYVNSFIFIIEKVDITTKIADESGIYYITKEGAYLDPQNVFENLQDAKVYALKLLDKFFYKLTNEIVNMKEK